MKKYILGFVLLITTNGISAESPRAQTIEKSISVNDTERSYMLYIPQNVSSNAPLIIFSHGGGGSAKHSFKYSGFNDVADQNKFIVAYSNGNEGKLAQNLRTWNAGRCCGPSIKQKIDDVAYFDSMMKDILKQNIIDPKRVYISGMSNGAMMTYRLVCELPEYFAAAVAVSGTLGIEECNKGENIPFYHMHGSADTTVPFNGGKGRFSDEKGHRSVAESLKMIMQKRNCAEPVIATQANGNTLTKYTCKTGAPVQLLTIKEGEHEWPGGKKLFGGKMGKFSAAEEAWSFFKNYSK